MKQPGVAGSVVRAAILDVLPKTGEPATAREVATAVYLRTGNDRISYNAVHRELKVLESRGVVFCMSNQWRRVVPS